MAHTNKMPALCSSAQRVHRPSLQQALAVPTSPSREAATCKLLTMATMGSRLNGKVSTAITKLETPKTPDSVHIKIEAIAGQSMDGGLCARAS